jgi:hypothetical protein
VSSGPEPSGTDLELWHRVEAEPPGTFKLYRAVGAGIEENIQQHLKNLDKLKERIKHSVAAGCLIEVISIRLQIIDYWLRIYFVNHPSSSSRRKKEFGALLDQCHKIGLPDDLHHRLSAFNRHRIDAIHGYVVGTTSYQALEPVAKESDGLLRDVIEFVVSNSGTVVTHRTDLAAAPGALVIHVHGFCREVRGGLRY